MPVTTCPIRDEHCVCCGDYTKSTSRVKITPTVAKNYEAVYGKPLPVAYFIATIICSTCYSNLAPSNRAKRASGLKQPFEWIKPATDHSDCPMCLFHQTKNKHYRRRSKAVEGDEEAEEAEESEDEDEFDQYLARQELKPSRMESSPVHGAGQEFESSQMDSSSVHQAQSSDFLIASPYESRKVAAANKFTATGLDNFAKEFRLSKSMSTRMASRFNDMHLLDPDCRVKQFENRSDYIQPYFTQFDLKTVFCNNVGGLFRHILQHEHHAEEWRMGVDGGKGSFKILLAHIGNRYPKVPLLYSRSLGEDYFSIRLALKLIKYNKFKWKIMADFKIIGILTGVPNAGAKYPCPKCLFDSRDKSKHYCNFDWQPRPEQIRAAPAENSDESSGEDEDPMLFPQLISTKDMYAPPLHLQLGFCQSFIKSLPKLGKAIEHIAVRFGSYITLEKVEQGSLSGLEIRHLFKDETFLKLLGKKHKVAWKAYRDLSENFLGNHRAANYEEIIKKFLLAFKDIGVNMSLKLHVLESHLDWFAPNCGEASDQDIERFHQELSNLEQWYAGRISPGLLSEFVWFSVKKRDTKCEIEWSREEGELYFFID